MRHIHFKVWRTVDKAYIDAVQQGYLPESTLDTALIRLFTARIKLGMFDPPEMVPYTKIDEKELDSAEHRALARKLANEAMVLLKNDGTPSAQTRNQEDRRRRSACRPDQAADRQLCRNQPTHIVSVLEGLKAEFPNATITYVPGTQFLRNEGNPVPDTAADHSRWQAWPEGGVQRVHGPAGREPNAPALVSRTEPNVNLADSNLPPEAAGKKTLGVRWTGFITAPETGDYLVGVRAQRLRKTDRLTASRWRWLFGRGEDGCRSWSRSPGEGPEG